MELGKNPLEWNPINQNCPDAPEMRICYTHLIPLIEHIETQVSLEQLTACLTPALHSVANAFVANLHRIAVMARLPLASVKQRLIESHIQASIRGHRENEFQSGQTLSDEGELYRSLREQSNGKPVHGNYEMEIVLCAEEVRKFSQFDPPLMHGIEILTASLLINVWTVFEAFAVDLWKTSLNACSDLGRSAAFSGKKKNSDQGVSKSVPLETIVEFNFDLRDHMGDVILKSEKFKFKGLDGIIPAYDAAFGKDGRGIFAKKEHARLTVLEGIRNVLVHAAGKIDQLFVDRTKKNPNEYGALGTLKIGDDFPISCTMAGEFSFLIINLCSELFSLANERIVRKNINDGSDGRHK